ncbi:hypothetical protein [Spirosoma sp.]|uniref:hypothetical protein n=1 Tax=Spirosoma sp. TaxID=1899569 RepID=UPI002601ACF4|nr:hypothetical protein [Spirosoma sp.]MCX6218323.1 hypothetical protein [Spirosoma sp.]
MNKNEQLFADLKALLAEYPKMKYDDGTSDSSGEKIEAVRLPWYRTLNWKGEKDGKAEERLWSFIQNNGLADGPVKLQSLLMRYPYRVSFVRNTNKDVKADLYILIPFGWWNVGIKTTLIHT